MSKFRIVFRQVYLKNLKSGTYIWMVLAPLVFLLIGGVITIGIVKTQQPVSVALVTPQAELAPLVASLPKKNDSYQRATKITTEAQAKRALSRSKLDGYAVLTSQNNQMKVSYVSRASGQGLPFSTLDAQFNQVSLQYQAERLQLSGAALQTLLAPIKTTQTTVAFNDQGKAEKRDNNQQVVNTIVATAVSVLMMMFIMMYAGMIASEVAAEKGTRIMEIVLSSINVNTQFIGKIVAILALIMTQLGVYVVLGLVGKPLVTHFLFQEFPAVKSMLSNFKLPGLAAGQLVLTGLFLIVGIMTYTVLAAMLGSLVSSVEQAQQAITPLSMVAVLAYVLGIMAGNGVNNTLIKVTAFVPLLSPILAPARVSAEAMSVSAGWLSLLISVVVLVLLYYVSLIFYRANVLVYSDSNLWQSWRASWRILTNRQRQSRS